MANSGKFLPDLEGKAAFGLIQVLQHQIMDRFPAVPAGLILQRCQFVQMPKLPAMKS
jgi:hypothetical protein